MIPATATATATATELQPEWRLFHHQNSQDSSIFVALMAYHPRESDIPAAGCLSYEFARLIELWHTERGITSAVSDMIVCPSYLKIIGMGKRALPLILDQLKHEGDDPDHWFAALEAITGEDPVTEDAYGDTERMAAAWLSWAEKSDVQ